MVNAAVPYTKQEIMDRIHNVEFQLCILYTQYIELTNYS